MSAANPNAAAALALVRELSRFGAAGVCISPGARSSALVMAVLKTPALKPWVILDERSAAYFALGAARESGYPALLICTSGTAAASCLPAIVEASLSHTPLIVITADRPPELQDCHAPQTIDQRRLYGVHARLGIELPAPGGAEGEDYYRTAAFRAFDAALGMPPGPVHINFPMREPLIDADEERAALSALKEPELFARERAQEPGAGAARVTLRRALPAPAPEALEALCEKLDTYRRGVILCGPGLIACSRAPNDRAGIVAGAGETGEAVRELARRLSWPILADPLSGLRFGSREVSHIVDAYDVTLRSPELCRALFPEAVIQFGRPLTSKAANAFFARQPLPFYLIAAPWGSWPDPGRRATDAIRAEAGVLARALGERVKPAPARWLSRWLSPALAARRYLNRALAAGGAGAALSECALFTTLLPLLPQGVALHVGNSMPVRDLDTFSECSARRIDVFCNRGANGIDGVLSAAAGAGAVAARPVVVVLGDLSFLHDLGALKAAADHARHLIVVVVNNNGGGIFSFLPQAALGEVFETYFAAPHGLKRLEPAAQLYGASYSLARSAGEFARAVTSALGAPGLYIVEIQTERVHNVALHRSLIEGALEAARQALASAF